jgi:hypothetical protein
MKSADINKAHELLTQRQELLQWKRREAPTTEVVFTDDALSSSFNNPTPPAELRILIPRERAVEWLDAALKDVEEQLTALGVEFGDEKAARG